MRNHRQSFSVQFEPVNNPRLMNMCGPFNEHIQDIEHHFKVSIYQHGHHFEITGDEASAAGAVLEKIYVATLEPEPVTREQVQQFLRKRPEANTMPELTIHTRHKNIQPRNPHQGDYVQAILSHDINFGIGPAGTGKTYLAVACAVQALEQGHVERLIFVRPAVEAGEKLGFLPGDMEEKVLPYLRPIYDALYEMLGFDDVEKLIEKNIIEIAPLAFMRGRTLNNAFIILDEAQNTTVSQMQMFLTRLGYGSTAVITGDITQIDLPNPKSSGLQHAANIVKGIPRVSITEFVGSDSVRHPLVSLIIAAYEKFNAAEKNS